MASHKASMEGNTSLLFMVISFHYSVSKIFFEEEIQLSLSAFILKCQIINYEEILGFEILKSSWYSFSLYI